MSITRREPHFPEDSKVTAIPFQREDSSFSVSRELHNELTQMRDPQPSLGVSLINRSGIAPPPNVGFSTTAHKSRRFDARGRILEETKGEFEPSFIRASRTERSFAPSVTNSSARELSESCVTVFGYSPVQAREVLNVIGKYGKVVEYEEKGQNWMNVRYSTPKEAENALRLHGTQLKELDIMIGVKRCEDREFYQRQLGNTTRLSTVDEMQASSLKSFWTSRPQAEGWFTQVFEHIFNW